MTNVEAQRAAQGINEHQAREMANKKLLDEQNALAQDNVPEIPKAEAMRTEERKGRDRHAPRGGGAGAGATEEPGEDEAGGAISADGHLDFLA